ncbi:MAG: cell division protein [Proteobacteria bacterium]|nr:MAG: cell division protein [Pseudomonadota bacterium]
MRPADLRPLRVRLRIAQTLVLAAFAVLALRAAHLTLLGERGERRGESQLVTALSLAPERGRILDRNGTEVAMTVAVPSVYGVPVEVKDAAATAAELAKLLGVDAKKTRARLEQRRAFVYVDRWVDPARMDAFRARGGIPGIGVVDEPRRAYPFGPLAASVVGFANMDGVGVRGVEQQENEWLLGRPRRVAVERDARGRLLLGPGLERNATAGGDVALTLDVAMQAEAEQALLAGVQASRARGGYLVALDPKTGDVLALAEAPRFDPNDFRRLAFADTRARSFTDAVEPGSTFKTFLIAAALDAGSVTPTDVFDLRGGLRVPGKLIKDLHPRPVLDVSGILRHSSNVGSVKIAQRLGAERHFDTLRRFGFGQRTGSGFPDESSGLLRAHQNWRPVDAATVAFGQGVSVTTVQLAAATAALGNQGVWVRPRLIRGHRRPDGSWETAPPSETRQAVSPATAAKMIPMMEGVIVGEGGTGKRAQLAGVRVGGKTGTAQKLVGGRYAHDKYVAWFIGLAPLDDPRIAIAVGIDEPRGVHTGGAVAAPVFARAAAAILTHMGIATAPVLDPNGQPIVRVADASAQALPPVAAAGPAADAADALVEDERRLVPDLHGLTIEEVKKITAGVPVELEIFGRGRAVAQEPDPGTVLAGDRTRLRVRFSGDGGEG